MSLHRTAIRNGSTTANGIRAALAGIQELLNEAAIALAVCCTIGWVLHTAPTSMNITQAGSEGHDQPTFSAQIADGAPGAVCPSSREPLARARTCQIDLLGAHDLTPGTTTTTRVTLTSTGSGQIGAMSLHPLAGCSQTPAAPAPDLCKQVQLRIRNGSRLIFNGTAADLGRRTDTPIALDPIPAHATETLTTDVSLPSALGNEYQGLSARLPVLLSVTL